ncbi:MAG TPA: hypothetical protein PLL77_13175 [Pyrinomonadaceae bacterium]|nr:hypothetical protein [Pyrinomonadaceae bacterium]
MKRFTILSILFIICLTAQASLGQSQKERERTAFIANAKLLEKKPFEPNSAGAREWGFKWLIETDDVSVSLCTDTMKLIPEKKNRFKSELLMQFSFGMAVFKLENPDQKSDEKAANLAGIESVLRTYEAMLASNDKAKNTELETLVAKRNSGELKAIVDAAACPEKEKNK